jgi:hypothetical protein
MSSTIRRHTAAGPVAALARINHAAGTDAVGLVARLDLEHFRSAHPPWTPPCAASAAAKDGTVGTSGSSAA